MQYTLRKLYIKDLAAMSCPERSLSPPALTPFTAGCASIQTTYGLYGSTAINAYQVPLYLRLKTRTKNKLLNKGCREACNIRN